MHAASSAASCAEGPSGSGRANDVREKGVKQHAFPQKLGQFRRHSRRSPYNSRSTKTEQTSRRLTAITRFEGHGHHRNETILLTSKARWELVLWCECTRKWRNELLRLVYPKPTIATNMLLVVRLFANFLIVRFRIFVLSSKETLSRMHSADKMKLIDRKMQTKRREIEKV